MSDSFVEIHSQLIQQAAKEKLSSIQNRIDTEKEAWFIEERTKTKRYGFLKLNSRQLTEEEVYVNYRSSCDGMFSYSPYFYIESLWNDTINRINRIVDMSNKNNTVYLTSEDYALIFNKLKEKE